MTPRARMRLVLVYGAYILGLSLLQVTWPDALMIRGTRPDLALVFAVVAGYLYGRMDGAAVGLLCGFMLDMQSGRILGLGMLSLMMTGLLPGLLFRRVFRKSAFYAAGGVMVAAMLFHASMYALSYLYPTLRDLGRNAYDFENLFWIHVFPSVLLDAAIAVPMTFLVRKFGPYRKTTLDAAV